jgi:hypothetical protein
LQTNLDNKEHQIIIFVDTDNENSLEHLLSIKKDFYDLMIIENTLDIPIGYQRNKTILIECAKYDIVSYLQADMVVGPHYDSEILQHVKRGRILSATRVEPPLHGESPLTVTKNLGLHPKEFNMDTWNTFSESIKRDELVEHFFAPMTFFKEDWLKLGGYDTVFRRSREDSDFVQRCLHADIEMIQTFSANVYHFTCVSSRGKDWFDTSNIEAQEKLQLQNLADRIELRKFIRKWGNFNHGDSLLYKLDIDVVLKNYELQAAYELEPFFSRVWLTSDEHKSILVREYNSLQNVANTLFVISDDKWLNYNHLYRMENFEEIFFVGEPTKYNMKVTIDFQKIGTPNQFLSSLPNLYELLVNCEPGEYELDNVHISVNNVRVLDTPIVAANPEFDSSLLKVYGSNIDE